MLKFGQKKVTTKDFHGQIQINYIFTINVNMLVVSDKVPCNNENDCCYILGYQSDDDMSGRGGLRRREGYKNRRILTK